MRGALEELFRLQTCYLEKVEKISNPIKFKVVCFKLKGDLKSCGEIFSAGAF